MKSKRNPGATVRERTAIGLLFTAFSMVVLMLFGGTAHAAEARDDKSTNDATSADEKAPGEEKNASNDDAKNASNDDAKNDSKGDSNANTGGAGASGNDSGTAVKQNAEPRYVCGTGGCIVIANQNANVPNQGNANAATGGNMGTGNASDNTAGTDQTGASNGTGAADSASSANGSG